MDQAFVVLQGVSSVYSFVTGDERIRKAVNAIIQLAEFLLGAIPPLVRIIMGAVDIVEKNEFGVVVAALLLQYAVSVAPEFGETVGSIKEAIKRFADIIASLAGEQRDTGRINPLSVIREILDHGEAILDYAVAATKAFTHPTCSITANVAFTIETAGDDRFLGPWVQRGTNGGKPRYTKVGDRSTNLEYSFRGSGGDWNLGPRWVMFSDGWSGVFGRKYMYAGPTRKYPFSGWNALEGKEPLPEFTTVEGGPLR